LFITVANAHSVGTVVVVVDDIAAAVDDITDIPANLLIFLQAPLW
jgi:hypothetical protein